MSNEVAVRMLGEKPCTIQEHNERLAKARERRLARAKMIKGIGTEIIEKPKVETPKVETPKVETPKVETPEVETPEVETPKVDDGKSETPRTPITPRTPRTPRK